MTKTDNEEKPWMYLVFFLMGIISLPIGIFLEVFLIQNNINLEQIFCILGQCIPETSPQFLVPLLVYSILFTIGLYVFKNRSFLFALKVLVLSIIASSIVLYSFYGFGGYFIFFPLIILLIILVLGFHGFKDKILFNFSLRAFAVSFIAFCLINIAWLWWSFSTGAE